METESDTPPPAKKLCTETTAVNKTPESATKTTEENSISKQGSKDDVGKDEGPENEAVHPQQQDALERKTESENKAASENEAVTEVPVDPQGQKKGESPQNSATTDKPSAGKTPAVKDPNSATGKAATQAKKGGKQNGYEKNRPAAIDHVDLSRVIQGIQVCDYEIEEMTISANQKVVEIERSLREAKKPVYFRRSDLIQHIPEFWLTTLINHHHISHFINEADEDCLQYLKKLHVEEFDDSVSGFKISFVFDANPYFENEVLCKEISYGVSGVLRSKATAIRWKPGHDLTRVTEASASSSKSMPRSFFHWFLQNSNPVQDKVAVFIRDDIWPNPLKYFQVHTEDSSIDVSSDGIMVDSSGDEDDVMVLDESRDEEYDDDLDDEDIELLENEEELLDEEFDSEEEDLLMQGDDDEEIDDDELMLIESHGPPSRLQQQKAPIKKTAVISRPSAKAPPPKAAPVRVLTKVAPASTKASGTSKAPPPPPLTGNNPPTTAPRESSDTVSGAPEDGSESRTEPNMVKDAPKNADAKDSCRGVSEGGRDAGSPTETGDKKGAPPPSEDVAGTDPTEKGNEASGGAELAEKTEGAKPSKPSSTVTVKS